MRLCLSVLALCLTTVFGQECYQDWIYHSGSCYGFGEEPLSWADAQEMCKSFDSHLAEIANTDENDFLKGLATSRQDDNYWLGGTDIFHEGVWEWVSNREVMYAFTDWYPGEPNDIGGHEDCMVMAKGYNYQWNDAPCDYKCHFICEASSTEVVVG